MHVLDPFKASCVPEDLRSRFNPLDALDPASKETVDEAGRVADALVVMGEGDARSWDESARMMVKGLILHVLTSEEFEGRCNLITVRVLDVFPDGQSVNEALRALADVIRRDRERQSA